MTQEQSQIALGLIAAAGIWLGLDYLSPSNSTSLEFQLIRMCFFALIAFGIGGFVAKRGFLIPALVLALVVWSATTVYSLSIGWKLGNPMWSQFIWNLPSLVLMPAVAIGTLVGTAAAKRIRTS